MQGSRDIVLRSIDGVILLRPPQVEHAQAIYQAVRASLHELIPWMDWCGTDYAMEDTMKWLEALPDSWNRGVEYQFTIFDGPGQACLGGCGLNHINPFYRMANLGYWVRSDRTGKGIASTAARLVADFGFRELGLRRIEVVAGVENLASRRTAVKAGARFEGILRHRIILGDENIDAAMYSLLPEDLQEEDG